MPSRRTPRLRLSPRNVYVADYLTEAGLYRVYAVTSKGSLLVLDEDAPLDSERRHFRDVALEDVDATVADLHILLDISDPMKSGVSVRPKWIRLVSVLVSVVASLPFAA